MRVLTRTRAAGLAAALTLAGGVLAPSAALAAEPVTVLDQTITLENGHIDAFNLVLNEDDSPRLVVKEDVTGSHVLRTADSVELLVKEGARMTVPENYLPGMPASIYHLPLTQDANLIWPGWDTNALVPVFGANASTDIVVSAVDGPGQVFLWTTGNFGAAKSLIAGGGYTLPGTIQQPYPAHTHAAWAFTAPGTYKFTVRADVSGEGKTASSNTATYTFVVAERTQLTPAGPTRSGNTVTIPETPWITYTDADGAPLTAGELELTEDLTVRAVPALGFEIADSAASEWALAYETPAPELAITGLSHHYHQGSPILLQAASTPAVEHGSYAWYVQRKDQSAPVRVDGATDATLLLAAEQAYDEARISVSLLDGEGAEIATAPAVAIDVDDHGAAPYNVLSIRGAADHYHTGATATLTADVAPVSVLNRYEWYVQAAGSDEWQPVPGEHRSSYSFTVTEALEGARIRALLTFDDGAEYVASEPVAIEIDDHHEPVDIELSITGLADSYRVGDAVALGAVQNPGTEEDHYHWFIKRAGDADYSVIRGQATAQLAYTAADGDDRAQVIARLYDHDHEVIAESAPAVLRVTAAAVQPKPDSETPAAGTPDSGKTSPGSAAAKLSTTGVESPAAAIAGAALLLGGAGAVLLLLRRRSTEQSGQ